MSNPVLSSILDKLGDDRLIEKMRALPPTELQSLLLEIFRRRAADTTPQELLKSYETNRFVVPSAVDPLTFYRRELEVMELAQASFQGLELSPLAPLGSCSVVALADQNKIVSAGRGTEVVADATNLMALECAVRRKKSGFDESVVHLCSVHRHVRAQALPDIKGFTPHFKVFTAVSAGRDTGSMGFEKMAMLHHLAFYKKYFVDTLGLSDTRFIIKGLTPDLSKSRQLFNHVSGGLPGVPISFEEVPGDQNRYYQHTRFSLNVGFKGREYNIGDGGFVDWSAKLTSNGKERMFTSGIGLELVIKLMSGMI